MRSPATSAFAGTLLQSGGGIKVVLAVAFVTPFLVVAGLFGFGIGAMLWALLKPPRPESLTLTASGLRHDAGHFVPTDHPSSGKRCYVPHPELGRIRLEYVDGRQRLTFDRGVERIEVGACLEEPEREWLAEALRRWAGRPDTNRPEVP